MKKTILVALVVLGLSLCAITLGAEAKKPDKWKSIEYWDIDGDGIDDEITVFNSEQEKGKSFVKYKDYYIGDGDVYLGYEQWINGELVEDTFSYND